MKKRLILATIILCLVSISYGQKATPKQTPTTKTPENSVIEETSDAEDRKLISDLYEAEIKVFGCYITLLNKTNIERMSIEERKIFFSLSSSERISQNENQKKLQKTCSKSAEEDLTESYNKLLKSPNAVKIMIVDDFVRRNIPGTFTYQPERMEKRTEDHQLELQRIITIQNQRIIELLEQLVKKKP